MEDGAWAGVAARLPGREARGREAAGCGRLPSWTAEPWVSSQSTGQGGRSGVGAVGLSPQRGRPDKPRVWSWGRDMPGHSMSAAAPSSCRPLGLTDRPPMLDVSTRLCPNAQIGIESRFSV